MEVEEFSKSGSGKRRGWGEHHQSRYINVRDCPTNTGGTLLILMDRWLKLKASSLERERTLVSCQARASAVDPTGG